MTSLADLTHRFSRAAKNPPRLRTKFVQGSRTVVMSALDSQGKNRPVVRQTIAQQNAIRAQAVAQAKSELITQARADLIG